MIVLNVNLFSDTMYGKVFHVVAVDNPNNLAYTNLPIPFHQDLWY
jgi:hypothetical protein